MAVTDSEPQAPNAPKYRFVQQPDPACLSEAEQIRMEGFGSPVRRAQFLLGRTALRQLAAAHLGCVPAEVPLALAPSGAPVLPGTGLYLSLSHSLDGALAVLAPHPVGCDLEAPPLRPRDVLALSHRFFSPSESALLEALDPAERTAAFLTQWTRKEAAYKSGAVDWPEAVATAWQEGPNPLAQGHLFLTVPDELPDGWTARIALFLAD